MPSKPTIVLRVAICAALLAMWVPIATPAKPIHGPKFCVGSTAEDVLDESKPADRQLLENEAVVLLANHKVYVPGQTVFARLVNPSSDYVTYSPFAFIVWRRTASGWIRDPVTPERKWPLVGAQLRSGGVGVCTKVKLPDDQKAGHYKISKQIAVRGQPSTSRAARFVVSARR